MRYLWLVLFGMFVTFAVVFISQNLTPVTLNFSLDWIGLYYNTERPLYVLIFLTFAIGVIFTALYFLVYHTQLRFQLYQQTKEVQRLKVIAIQEKQQIEQLQQKNQNLEKEIAILRLPTANLSTMPPAAEALPIPSSSPHLLDPSA